ncbi:MAG: YegS/Rv2252/BmrU family lipid kinase [Desulfobacterales bacterium]|jgi:YegS/Rv2252/BmrU family lipid kinase
MKIALFVNLRPNGRRVGPAVRSILDRLSASGVRVDLFATRHLAQLAEVLSRLRPERFDGIGCAGGDGTHYHLLNGLGRRYGFDTLPPLAIFPLGRGNSFARDLNLCSAEDAVTALLNGTTRPVDLCRFSCNGSEAFFANLMGVGFVTDVAATAARFARAGDLSYVIGVFHRLASLRPFRLELRIDGNCIDGRFCFVEFCNSRYTGGSMLMAPGARIDDGLFDVILAGAMTPFQLACSFPLIYRGAHLSHPAVQVVRAKTARIAGPKSLGLLPDGELFGSTPADIEVVPRCVRYFTR